MEVGAAVWVKDKEGEEAWIAGTVLEKSADTPCTVQIEVDEEFSEEPLTFTFGNNDGERDSTCMFFCTVIRNVSVASRPKMPTDFWELFALCSVGWRAPASLFSRQRGRRDPCACYPSRAGYLCQLAKAPQSSVGVDFFSMWRPLSRFVDSNPSFGRGRWCVTSADPVTATAAALPCHAFRTRNCPPSHGIYFTELGATRRGKGREQGRKS